MVLSFHQSAGEITNIEIGVSSESDVFWTKQNKVKEFKQSDSTDVCQWLQQFDSNIQSFASATCKLDLEAVPLTPQEFAKLLRYKIPHLVETEIGRALETVHKTWETAAVNEIRTAMKNLYEKKEPQVCSLLKFSVLHSAR